MALRTRALVIIPLIVGIAGVIYDMRTGVHDEAPDTSGSVAVDISKEIGTTYFCPGIPGGDLADGGAFLVANRSSASAIARFTLISVNGAVAQEISVPAHSTTELPVGDEYVAVAAIVELDVLGAVVEQRSQSPAGTIHTMCSVRTSPSWYFADGFTAAESNELIVLSNPYADAAIVDVAYSTLEGERRPNAYQGFVLPAKSLRTIDMAEIGARNEPVLSVKLQASSGSFVAGRVQRYRGNGRQGLGVSLGAFAPSTDWWFGFGDKSESVNEQLIVYNPGNKKVSVDVVLAGFVPKDAIVEPITIEVAARSSSVLDINGIATLPVGNHSISVGTRGSGVVVVERVNNVSGNGGSIATTVAQAVAQSRVTKNWIFATVAPGARISLQNITGYTGTFSVSGFGPAGEAVLTGLGSTAIDAGGTAVVTIPADAPTGPVVIRSSVNAVVERLASRGAGLLGYSASPGQPFIGQ